MALEPVLPALTVEHMYPELDHALHGRGNFVGLGGGLLLADPVPVK
jgi:hypothetical protein